jgi:Protein of Unknown function (DUF2784)
MWYLCAADLVLVAHLLFIGFVVGGSFLAWRWPRVIWVQLPAMVYGVLVELAGFACPLTGLQNYLLRRGGRAGYRGGFISHYLIQVIYPPGLTRGIQVGLGLFVVLIAVAGYGGYLRRYGPAGARRQSHQAINMELRESQNSDAVDADPKDGQTRNRRSGDARPCPRQ